jgi:hypothetical protein
VESYEYGVEPKRQKWAKTLQELQVETAWDSAEYKSYFNSSDKESVTECLQRRIDDLAHVNRGEGHWKDVIDNHDKDNICTSSHIFYIRNKCLLLAIAYKNALNSWVILQKLGAMLREGDL